MSVFKFPVYCCVECGKPIPKGFTLSGEEIDKGIAMYSVSKGITMMWHHECFSECGSVGGGYLVTS